MCSPASSFRVICVLSIFISLMLSSRSPLSFLDALHCPGLPRAVRVQKNCRVGPQSCQAQASFWGPCYYFAVLGGKKLAFFFMIFKYS